MFNEKLLARLLPALIRADRFDLGVTSAQLVASTDKELAEVLQALCRANPTARGVGLHLRGYVNLPYRGAWLATRRHHTGNTLWYVAGTFQGDTNFNSRPPEATEEKS